MKKFKTSFGFLCAAIGSAVGLGNIWSFPANAATYGGSAFVIATLVFSFLIAYPVLACEIMLGRTAPHTGLPKILGHYADKPASTPFLSGSAWLMILNVSLILTFYAIVGGWVMKYGVKPYLPEAATFENARSENIFYALLFMSVCFIVSRCNFNKGVELASTVMMPLLFVLLVGFFIFNLTQDAAMEGFAFYLQPDFSKLLDPHVILKALGQSFFSVSAGLGIMAVYGACLAKDVNIKKYARIIVFADVLVAFIAGLVVIPAMFIAKNNNINIFNEAGELIEGTTLVFDVLPALFAHMGFAGTLLSPVFFIALLIAGITSALSILEVPISMLEESFGYSRNKAAAISFSTIASVAVILCIFIDWLMDFFITLTTSYVAPMTSILLCLIGTLFLTQKAFSKAIVAEDEEPSDTLMFKYVKYACPVLIIVIMVYGLL